MPGTWATYGKDVNNDGDGPTGSPFDPQDGIFAAARYDCALLSYVKAVPGDPVSLMLAAYNAGPGAVKQYNGIPPFKETQDYVRIITANAAKFAAPTSAPILGADAAAERARADQWVAQHIPYSMAIVPGRQYRWDCSGYVSYIWGLANAETTATLPDFSINLEANGQDPRSIMQFGDILVKNGGAGGGHTLLFDRWADASRTSYWAYEESPDSYLGYPGAKHRIIPWRYFHDGASYTVYRKK
jgi:hypothetical protein